MEPFKGTDVPVLILANNIDEICFQQSGKYKEKQFVNIEASFEEIQKDIDPSTTQSSSSQSRLPEDDTTSFCLWLKNELGHSIEKVTLSKRLKDMPAIVVG
jgi:HSP90 family molecular chaperone